MTSPLTRGLIHGVAMQSSVPAGCEIKTLAEDENGTGRTGCQGPSCDSAADIAGCLRGKTTKEIVKAVPGYFSVFAAHLRARHGRSCLSRSADQNSSRTSAARAMPVIIGGYLDETWSWADTLVNDEASYVGGDRQSCSVPPRANRFLISTRCAFPPACCVCAGDHGRRIHLPGPPFRPCSFRTRSGNPCFVIFSITRSKTIRSLRRSAPITRLSTHSSSRGKASIARRIPISPFSEASSAIGCAWPKPAIPMAAAIRNGQPNWGMTPTWRSAPRLPQS